MPGLNRKGPNGEGPMTGNKNGLCNPENKDKDLTPGNSRKADRKSGNRAGAGRRKGRGLGLRNRNRKNS